MHVVGLRLLVALPPFLPPVFFPNLLVRFATSAVSLALEGTNVALFIVSDAIACVSFSNTEFLVVAVAARLSK